MYLPVGIENYFQTNQKKTLRLRRRVSLCNERSCPGQMALFTGKYYQYEENDYYH